MYYFIKIFSFKNGLELRLNSKSGHDEVVDSRGNKYPFVLT